MPSQVLRPLMRHVRWLAEPSAGDGELLRRFARERDDGAFRELVERHGSLVLAMCRRHAGQEQDAEDAFQSTFLLLARKAGSLAGRSSIAGWLAATARNCARRARRTALRRAVHEARATPASRPNPEPGLRDLCFVLDAEVERLPPAEREVFVHCVLEGLTKPEAASRLGWPEGTVSGRLARARERLRDRLGRRGVSLSAALAALGLASRTEAVPSRLCDVVVQAATQSAARLPGFAARGLAFFAASIAIVFAVEAGRTPTSAEDPKSPTVPAKAEPAPRVDFVGDPLPERVLARIGHARFRHEEGVRAIALSPDGKTVATSTWLGMIRLWDADTGKLRQSWDARAKYGETSLQFLKDGKELFVGLVGEALPPHIVDVATGKVVWKHAEEPNNERRANGATVILSPDGKIVLESWNIDGQTRATDRATGKVLFDEKLVDRAKGQYLRSLRFLPDGKTFLLRHAPDANVLECSAETGQVVRTYELGLQFAFATISPDGKKIAAYQRGDFQKPEPKDTVVIWDREKNLKLATVEKLFPDPICLAFSPDGKTFAVGSQGSDIVLLNAADGAEVRRFKWHPSCLSLLFSPDGKTLFAGDSGGQLAKWDVATGELEPTVSVKMPDSVFAAEFRANGTELLTDGDQIAWWDPNTGRPLRTIEAPKIVGFSRGRVSPDGKKLVFAKNVEKSAKSILMERDVATGQERILNDSLPRFFGTVSFSTDGRRMVVGGFDPVVRVLDSKSGAVLFELKDHKKYVDQAFFSADGKWIVSHARDANARGDYDICVWDAATGKLVHKLLPGRGSAFQCVLTPDGRHLLAVGGEPGRVNPKGELHIWELATGKLVKSWDAHAERAVSVSISPDGRSILTCGIDRKVKLWEFPSGLLRHEFKGHAGPVYALSFAPDGRRFVATSGDAPCFIWDVYGHLTSKPAQLSSDDATRVWADLTADDPAIGFGAVCRLASAGESGVVALKSRLKPTPTADAKLVDKALEDLKSNRFTVREKAVAELTKVADQIVPRLRKLRESELDADVRESIDKLLSAAEADTPESRRQLRAIEALAVIGSASARGVLVEMSRGDPGARLTEAARSALERN